MQTLIAHIAISGAVTNKASGTGYGDNMHKQQRVHIWAEPIKPCQCKSATLPDFAATLTKMRRGATEIHTLNQDGFLQRKGDIK